ncbi:hypothetical protein [Litchfieldella rifensis]|uniref:Uncharacterized protein n=1 Tax=Litchfieldella rifensis TaxID=762643 RepID=A0ABV7LUJ8_9GAMM
MVAALPSAEHFPRLPRVARLIPVMVGMLVTLDDEMPRARPMHLVQDEYDGTLWFFTPRAAGEQGLQLYEFAKANIKKDATPNLGENEKFGG